MALSCFLLLQSVCSQQPESASITMGKVRLEFSVNTDGEPSYQLYFDRLQVIKPSRLGLLLKEETKDASFSENMQVLKIDRKQVNDTWEPVWGEVKSIRNQYEELTIHLQQREGAKRLIDVVFRVFADGVGFKYEFPHQPNLNYFILAEETTEFNLTGDHKTFWIPGDYDSNEYKYTTSPISKIDAWAVSKIATDIAVRVVPDQYAVQTPLMLKSADGLYINIHEAALVNYPALQLHADREAFKLSARLVPDALGNKAYLHAPCKTPWRTIIVSDKAADILNSKIILNLNDPSVIKDPSYIKPMKFVGVWWEMQTGKSTWSYAKSMDDHTPDGNLIASGKHGANTENVKKYIDFAASNGIQGVLVEGWNTGWEDWFGNWKDEVFDFVTPYPDFDIKDIEKYAASKGVKMIMHNETSGSAINYETSLDTAFKLMNTYGYPAVKTGYVGKIIPRGEHHDGQWMNNHYIRVAQKAAKYRVMLDAHEPSHPTGLHRTYPNWMANEAGRGNEYNAFSDGTAPDHETILPFTRLMGGPMDYTPGIFKLKDYALGNPERQMHSTLAKQLALYVTIYSPIQMAADYPENYEKHLDAFQFIKDVGVDWDDTKIIEAEPGDYLTIARKAKGTDNWFIGAITDENKRTAVIPLNFLNSNTKYQVVIYADAKNASWKDNPEAYQITRKVVKSTDKLTIELGSGGGAAVSVVALP